SRADAMDARFASSPGPHQAIARDFRLRPSGRRRAQPARLTAAGADDAIPRTGFPLMTSSDRARHRLQSFGAFALYFALAALLLDRGLIGHPGYVIGRDTDQRQRCGSSTGGGSRSRTNSNR